jgi:hypothetical protein
MIASHDFFDFKRARFRQSKAEMAGQTSPAAAKNTFNL